MTDRSIAEKRKEESMDLLCLTLVWGMSIAIINPIGDFPLNDDWSFGLAVQYLLQLGSFHPTGWTAMPLLTNVIWGSLFCLPGGFSFTALRFSTLTASWLGILGAYWLLQKLGQSRSVTLLAALTLAFNPIYFELSNTFMTDVPCLTLMIFSAIFFLENLKSDSTSALIAATMLSLAAILSRQVGLAVPMAFTLVVIGGKGFKPRELLRALAPSIAGMFVLTAFQHWLKISGKLPAAYADAAGTLVKPLLHPAAAFPSLVHLTYVCLVSAGIFLSPILFLVGPSTGRATVKAWAGAGVVFVLLAGWLTFYWHAGQAFMLPLATNNFSLWGLGPLTLHDAIYLPANPLPMLPRGFWTVATIIGLAGAALLICRIFSVLGQVCIGLAFPMRWGYEEQAGVFLLLVSIIYMGPIMLSPFFDRYLIPIIPFLAGFLMLFRSQDDLRFKAFRFLIIAVMMLGLSVFSICGTRDYLAWSRARWEALDNLMANEHVKPESIDGGFEFNGFYLYSPVRASPPGKSFWWVIDDSYMITFNPVPGYSVLHDYHYTHWMPPYTGDIYVMKRDSDSSPVK
ncbi:MAG TPA: glycosyltransferase family 39 protein [Candidatus Acidoferrum sp.]|nr:glycosyltransferase family 39 protein [Candidatus Acidoferrum sp.]